MNDSSSSRSGRFPTDEQMDGLLRDFFTMETPSALKQSFQRSNVVPENVPAVRLVTEQSETLTPAPRSHRLVVASAISVLAMSLLLAMTVQNGRNPGSAATSIPGGTSAPVEPSEVLMLVSPQADLKSSTHTLSDDGLTIEETDAIELKSPN